MDVDQRAAEFRSSVGYNLVKMINPQFIRVSQEFITSRIAVRERFEGSAKLGLPPDANSFYGETMDDAEEEFLRQFGAEYGYPDAEKKVEEIRASEFKRLEGALSEEVPEFSALSNAPASCNLGCYWDAGQFQGLSTWTTPGPRCTPRLKWKPSPWTSLPMSTAILVSKHAAALKLRFFFVCYFLQFLLFSWLVHPILLSDIHFSFLILPAISRR